MELPLVFREKQNKELPPSLFLLSSWVLFQKEGGLLWKKFRYPSFENPQFRLPFHWIDKIGNPPTFKIGCTLADFLFLDTFLEIKKETEWRIADVCLVSDAR